MHWGTLTSILSSIPKSIGVPKPGELLYNNFIIVTRSRIQGKWVTCRKILILSFISHVLTNSKCFILMQTPWKLHIWLQSYEEFVDAKNNIKQKNLNTVLANISKSISPTSDSFPLILSQFSCVVSTKNCFCNCRLNVFYVCLSIFHEKFKIFH